MISTKISWSNEHFHVISEETKNSRILKWLAQGHVYEVVKLEVKIW